MKLASLLACTAVALTLVVLLGGSSLVSATEFRLLTSYSSGGYAYGRLLYQPSSADGTTWHSVQYSSFSSTEAKAMCRWLGFSSFVSATYSSISYSSSYPTSYAMSCSSSAGGISITTTMSSFSTYCSATLATSTSTATYLYCTESGEYTGGGIGSYAGTYSTSNSIYVRTYDTRFEFRFAHTTTWYSLCSYPSLPDATTQRAMCSWLNYYSPSSYAAGTSMNLNAIYMRSLDCSSSSDSINSCTYTLTSSCPTSSTSDTVTLSCTSSTGGTTPSPYSPPDYNTDTNVGVIIGASIGGAIGFIILVSMLTACCAAANGTATATGGTVALTNFPVANTQAFENKDQYGNNSQPAWGQPNPASQSWNQPPPQAGWGQPAPPPTAWGQPGPAAPYPTYDSTVQPAGYGAPGYAAPPPPGYGQAPPPMPSDGFYGGGAAFPMYGAPPPGFGAPPPNVATGAPPPGY